MREPRPPPSTRGAERLRRLATDPYTPTDDPPPGHHGPMSAPYTTARPGPPGGCPPGAPSREAGPRPPRPHGALPARTADRTPLHLGTMGPYGCRTRRLGRLPCA